MIVITGIRSEIATEDDNHEINTEEEEKIDIVSGNVGVKALKNDGVISSNDSETPKEDNELNDNIENDNRVEEFKDEIHEKISEEEIEDNANIVDGAEKEKDQISKDNMLKTEEIDLDIASNDTFVINTEETKASLNRNISYEHVNMNESNSSIYTNTEIEKESSFKLKTTSLEINSITSQIKVKEEPASLKEINMQVFDVRSDVLYSDLIKKESPKFNDHNDSLSDVDVSKEMTEIKPDISLDDIKGEPGLDTFASSSEENGKEDMFIIDGLVEDASDEEMDTNSTDSYSFDTYSINQYNPLTEPEAQSKPRIKCNKCDKTYNHKNGLTKHMQNSHKEITITNKEILKLECDSCQKKFDSRRSFQKHCITIHNMRPSDLRLSCDMCKETFTNTKDLDSHKNSTHPRVCSVCFKTFDSRVMLEKHVSREHPPPNQQFKCKRCKCDLPSTKKLKLHLSKCLANDQEKTFQCDICKQSFRKNITLKKHKEESHVNKFSENVIISQASVSKPNQQCKRDHNGQEMISIDKHESSSNLNKPAADNNDDEEDIMIVDSVMKTPIHQIILPKNVILSKAVQKQASRILESSSVQVLSKLPSNPVKRKVLDTEKGPFKCERCSKVFSFRYSLEQHMKDHDKCTNCNAAFSSTYELNVHHIACHGDLCNRCELCNFCVTDYSSLWRHLKTSEHAGIRSKLDRSKLKSCPVCKMVFLSQEGLEQHYKNHSPATTYVCELCLEKFLTPASLDVHKVWDHQIQPRDQNLEALIGVEYYNMEPQKWITSKGKRLICKICEFSVFPATVKEFSKHKKGFQHNLMRRSIDSKHSMSVLKRMNKTWKYHHCKECNNSFTTAVTLRNHLSTWHHPDFSLADIEANQNSSTFSLAEVGRVAYHQDDVDIVAEIINEDDDDEME